MIFLTVGTHEQSFDRLIKYVDELIKKEVIKEEVVMQIGYTTYQPRYCQWKKLYSYNEMSENMKKARIIITHGGPSSFMMALQYKKTPLVVPRQKKYHEHVNDHQVEFVKKVFERFHCIIPIFDLNDLDKYLSSDFDMETQYSKEQINNNEQFNEELNRIIEALFRGKND